jgi:L-rhamnose-H+ transport protein
MGASSRFSANVAWAIVLTSGGIINILYCLYLMVTRKTAKQFFGPETARNFGLGTLMGLLWCIGMYLYGLGAFFMGKLGVVMGWVIFMTLVIIAGNMAGIWRGEWKDAPAQARSWMNRGLIVLIAAIVVVAISSRFP